MTVSLLLVANIYSFSQSCLESYNKMNALYNEGKINEAIAIGERSLPIKIPTIRFLKIQKLN